MKQILVLLIVTKLASGFLIDSNVHAGSIPSVWEHPLDGKAQDLVNRFKDSNDCTTIYEACHNITTTITDERMAYKAVHDLSKVYDHNYETVPHQCTCTGHPVFWHEERETHHNECYRRDGNYKRMYDHFFGSGTNTKLDCNTHRSLWHGLVTITEHHKIGARTCQWTLIQEVSEAFVKQGSECHCSSKSETTTTSTTTTTTTTTTPSPTTTPFPTTTTTTSTSVTTTRIYPKLVCDKFKVIDAIAKAQYISATGTTNCSITSESSSDALLIDSCATGPATSWRKGNNVMTACQTNAIQPYTAIASFASDMTTFQSVGHLAAILIKCEPNGIEIAFQDCGQVPILKHLQTGQFGQLDPSSYYTIAV